MDGVTKTLVLVDAHAVLHRAYHALPDFTSPKGEPTGALYGVATFLMKIIKELDPTYIAACYDLPGPTFRHESYAAYKGTRQKADDALVAQMERSRDVFTALSIPIYDHPGFEADDMLGTIVEQTKNVEGLKVVIASGDMDTVQLVDDDRVVVYTLKKGLNDTIIYNEATVKERFGFAPELLIDYKGLRGDTSDNIPGIPGIGEKTATELIQKFGELEGLYHAIKKDRDAVIAQGIKPRIVDLLVAHEEEALFSKILATIRRDAPISYVLPEKSWREGFDAEKAKVLFLELGFRSLIPRLTERSAGPAIKSEQILEKAKLPVSDEPVDPALLKEASLGLWLLDSTRVEPDLQEILEWAGTGSFAEARAKINAELEKTGLISVLRDIELPAQPVFEAAEERGIMIDKKYLAKLSKEYHAELDLLQQKIWKQAGVEFNINSPKQLGEVLFGTMQLSVPGLKKTPTGARSTKESELEKLKEAHPIVADILSYREFQKLLSTYIDVLPTLADQNDRIHTHFVQSGAATGRISSRDPNMQNIPIKSEAGERIRRAFVATPGYKLLDIDYSQIQLRILAMLSHDETLTKIFKENGDVHDVVARNVFGEPKTAEEAKDARRKAKVINFGIIFGMGANALRQTLGTTRKEAEQFLTAYFERFPAVMNYISAVKESARKKGYTETLYGRRRYFPNIVKGPPVLRAAEERMAMNAPNQGTEADILKLAIARADTALKQAGLAEDVFLLLQVHDELVYEVKEEKVAQAIPIIREAMEGVMANNPLSHGIPLTVNVAVGDTWGDTEEVGQEGSLT